MVMTAESHDHKHVPVHDFGEVLGNIKKFLTERLGFSKDEASVYLAGLEEGTVTSVSLGRKSGIPPATANGILKRLTSKGYFASSLDDGSGKGHAVHYRVIPPEDAFRDFHKDYERFTEDLDVLSEQLENVSESDDRSSEMYLLRTKESAIIRGAKLIRAAKKSVKIYGHDITWLGRPDLETALEFAIRKKVQVELLATDLRERSEKTAKRMGILFKRVEFHGIPFCIVDDSTLLMPQKGGEFETEFGLLFTSSQYTVENYLRAWEHIRDSAKSEVMPSV